MPQDRHGQRDNYDVYAHVDDSRCEERAFVGVAMSTWNSLVPIESDGLTSEQVLDNICDAVSAYEEDDEIYSIFECLLLFENDQI